MDRQIAVDRQLSSILNFQCLLDLLDQDLAAGLIVERHSHPTRVHSPLLYPALRPSPWTSLGRSVNRSASTRLSDPYRPGKIGQGQ